MGDAARNARISIIVRKDNSEEVARRRAAIEHEIEERQKAARKLQEEKMARAVAQKEERLSRQRLAQQREMLRAKAVLDRRAQVLAEQNEKKVAVLAKAHAVASRLSAQQKARPVYAFGSSTPREISYLTQLTKEQKVYDRKLAPLMDRSPRAASGSSGRLTASTPPVYRTPDPSMTCSLYVTRGERASPKLLPNYMTQSAVMWRKPSNSSPQRLRAVRESMTQRPYTAAAADMTPVKSEGKPPRKYSPLYNNLSTGVKRSKQPKSNESSPTSRPPTRKVEKTTPTKVKIGKPKHDSSINRQRVIEKNLKKADDNDKSLLNEHVQPTPAEVEEAMEKVEETSPKTDSHEEEGKGRSDVASSAVSEKKTDVDDERPQILETNDNENVLLQISDSRKENEVTGADKEATEAKNERLINFSTEEGGKDLFQELQEAEISASTVRERKETVVPADVPAELITKDASGTLAGTTNTEDKKEEERLKAAEEKLTKSPEGAEEARVSQGRVDDTNDNHLEKVVTNDHEFDDEKSVSRLEDSSEEDAVLVKTNGRNQEEMNGTSENASSMDITLPSDSESGRLAPEQKQWSGASDTEVSVAAAKTIAEENRWTKERRRALEERRTKEQYERELRKAKLASIMSRTRGTPMAVVTPTQNVHKKEEISHEPVKYNERDTSAVESNVPVKNVLSHTAASVLQKLATTNPKLLSVLQRNGSNPSLADELTAADPSITLPGQPDEPPIAHEGSSTVRHMPFEPDVNHRRVAMK